jgi:hypothetical protein
MFKNELLKEVVAFLKHGGKYSNSFGKNQGQKRAFFLFFGRA